MKELIAVIAVIVLGVVVGMIILGFQDEAESLRDTGKADLDVFNTSAAEVNSDNP